jgi:membrane-associated phospholipid phosphatase
MKFERDLFEFHGVHRASDMTFPAKNPFTAAPLAPPSSGNKSHVNAPTRRKTNRFLQAGCMALCLAGAVGAAQGAGDPQATDAGTVLSFALPLATAGVHLWQGDREGLKQLAFTWTSSVVLAEALKQGTNRTRPDGSNDLSFPSGHAARAFAAAAHVNRRHGLQAAWPLYAGAVAVGWTRVQARRHDWLDVTGSLLLSEWMARTWSTPHEQAPRLSASRADGQWQLTVSWPL